MDIAEHTDQPVPVTLAGREYLVAELTIEAMGRLQAWVKKTTPHPVEAVKAHLRGLEPADRAVLLEGARKAAETWPPAIETQAGAQALLGRSEGQAELLWEALKDRQPDLTREDAARLIHRLRKHDPSGESLARVVRIAFGLPESQTEPGSNGDDEDADPKG